MAQPADDVRSEGLGLFGAMMGAGPEAAMATALDAPGLHGAMARLAVDFAFGSVWAREGLMRGQRSLVTIGLLIALRQPEELKNHFRIGLANGLLRSELEETVIQSIPYVGFPAATTAMTALLEVLDEARPDAALGSEGSVPR